MPFAGDVVDVLQVDDLVVALGSDSTNRPTAAAGETILYADKNTYVRLNPDKTVLVQSGSGSTIQISPDGSITIQGTKVTVQGSEMVNLLAPKVGVGEDATAAPPTDGIVTGSCLCMFSGSPHPMVSAAAFAPMVGSP
jgi:hypothetical protein